MSAITEVPPNCCCFANTALCRSISYAIIGIGAVLGIVGAVTAVALAILTAPTVVGPLAIIKTTAAAFCILGPILLLAGMFILSTVIEIEESNKKLQRAKERIAEMKNEFEAGAAQIQTGLAQVQARIADARQLLG